MIRSKPWMAALGLLLLAASPAAANQAAPLPTHDVGWSLSIRAIPVTLPIAARSIVDSAPATTTDLMAAIAMRHTRHVGTALYFGWEAEMASASTHTPVTVDHPTKPRGMSFLQAVVVAGVRAELRPLILGAELAAGGRILSRDYEGDRDLDGFEVLRDTGIAFEARVRAGISMSPRWSVGGVYGTSLVDETWTAGLYAALTVGRR